ncbi:hypothetical protein [Fenollaria massiliensis]|uniref:hypothetical protein n=1 Tax=Fenollaria massiliensis TaxID=938288 RepID=UPI00037E9CA9|nr:hypothetical protein [Fenollaria massiliensis]
MWYNYDYEVYKLNIREKIVLNLIIDDALSIYSLFKHIESRKDMDTYIVALTPILGLYVEGAVKWLKSNKELKDTVPKMNPECKIFYETLRKNTKFYGEDIIDIDKELRGQFNQADDYFSQSINIFNKVFYLHDNYGVTFLIKDKIKIPMANTIDFASLLPDFTFDLEYAIKLKDYLFYAGSLISKILGKDLMIDKNLYKIDMKIKFVNKDYGFFMRSSFSQKYNQNFILFNLICNINFILYGLNQLIIEDAPIKLRATYLLYYYLCSINSEINDYFNTSFNIDDRYSDSKVRNALAHYGLYQALGDDIIEDDLFGGLTNKYFNLNWINLLKELNNILLDYRDKILFYLEKNNIQIV